MSQEKEEPSVLPTGSVTKEETVILVRSLLVDWKVLEHLGDKGVIEQRFALRAEAACCKPDGGSCCVNRKLSRSWMPVTQDADRNAAWGLSDNFQSAT